MTYFQGKPPAVVAHLITVASGEPDQGVRRGRGRQTAPSRSRLGKEGAVWVTFSTRTLALELLQFDTGDSSRYVSPKPVLTLEAANSSKLIVFIIRLMSQAYRHHLFAWGRCLAAPEKTARSTVETGSAVATRCYYHLLRGLWRSPLPRLLQQLQPLR